MVFAYKELKARQRSEREAYPVNLSLRVHRALSWLDRAEQSKGDLDAEYVFLWVAFNAAYANDIDAHQQMTEQKLFRIFLNRLCDFDRDNRIYDFLWAEFTSSIRVLLANKYVFQPFWDFHNHKISESEWQQEFSRANSKASRALADKDAGRVLAVIFRRLYVLRNQILHGGTTWNSSVNRDQLRDGVAFLGKMVPIIIEIMMDNPNQIWGDPCYPVVE